MPWSSLRVGSRLQNSPLVLAGPILRKVTSRSVTVWVATKHACNVRLSVLGVALVPVSTVRPTTRLGEFLHIAAVTVNLSSPSVMLEGLIYRYDLEFQQSGPSGPWMSLRLATHDAMLYYGDEYSLPSFCLPPADLTQLRIVHGSCRKPHGQGDLDALALLDGLVADSLHQPLVRPHQLLLTGDQIYADDVAAGLLTMITDAADVLLGHGSASERMPLPPSVGSVPEPAALPGSRGWALATEMAPYQRNFALGSSGFTSEDMACHLMTLGEYLAMYLFAWSDVLWDDDGPQGLQLPSVASIVADMDARQEFMPHGLSYSAEPLMHDNGRVDYRMRRGAAAEPWVTFAVMSPQERKSVERAIDRHNKQLRAFHHTLKNVRRALAHVPTYMVFDDHEITDDWNMRMGATVKIHKSATGRRMVQNGLVAYALCQHWGNCPEQFAPDGDYTPAGLRLLEKLDGTTGTQYAANSADIARLVGLPPASDIESQKRMFHPGNALVYNYTVEGQGHQIVVADTRTWREYPNGREGGAVMLSEAQMHAQLRDEPAVPPLGNRMLLVALPTNAPPIRAIRTAEQAPEFASTFEHVPDVYEAWTLGLRDADLLFKVLSDRLPIVDGARFGAVVLLSGDVHHSFATELTLNGSARRDDPPAQRQPVAAVFAQLVSSALRNEDKNTREIGREGHDYKPEFYKAMLIPKGRREVLYGWNVQPGVPRTVGNRRVTVTSPRSGSRVVDEPVVLTRSETLGGIFDSRGGVVGLAGLAGRLVLPHEEFVMSQTPDWIYNLSYRGSLPVGNLPPQPLRPASGSPDRSTSAAQYVLSLRGYTQASREGSRAKDVVGVNNICEITFGGPAASRVVRHTMRWADARARLDAPLRLRFASIPISLKPLP